MVGNKSIIRSGRHITLYALGQTAYIALAIYLGVHYVVPWLNKHIVVEDRNTSQKQSQLEQTVSSPKNNSK